MVSCPVLDASTGSALDSHRRLLARVVINYSMSRASPLVETMRPPAPAVPSYLTRSLLNLSFAESKMSSDPAGIRMSRTHGGQKNARVWKAEVINDKFWKASQQTVSRDVYASRNVGFPVPFGKDSVWNTNSIGDSKSRPTDFVSPSKTPCESNNELTLMHVLLAKLSHAASECEANRHQAC
jgi:hypothetical protein